MCLNSAYICCIEKQIKIKIMKLFCNLSNGNQEQVQLIGDNKKILDFISNYEGDDLGNELILQDFIEDVLFTGVVMEIESDVTEEKLIKYGFSKVNGLKIKNEFQFEYGDFYFVLDENNGYYHLKLSNHCFNHKKQVGLGIFKDFNQLIDLINIITGL